MQPIIAIMGEEKDSERLENPSTSEEKKKISTVGNSSTSSDAPDEENSKTLDPSTMENRKIEDATEMNETAVSEPKSSDEEDDILDNENAEDAEDSDNKSRHAIPLLDYEAMSMDNLVGELQKLVRNEKVQSIKKHVDSIKNEFDEKFDDFLERKKEKFIAEGGNEIDFRYNSNTKTQFNAVYKDYREKRNQYYKGLEKNLRENLASKTGHHRRIKGTDQR